MKKIIETIKTFIANVTRPVRTSKWYCALNKIFRALFWMFVVGLIWHHNLMQILAIVAIVAYGYVSAHGMEKAKADAKAVAGKAITKVKDLSK